MPQNCAVPCCPERKGGHQFPRDKTILRQWLVAIRRPNYTPSKYARVCKNHFAPEDYVLPKESYSEKPPLKLGPEVVPSRFPWNEKSEERKKRRKYTKSSIVCDIKSEPAHTEITEDYQSEEQQELFPFEVPCEEIDIKMSLSMNASVQCSLCKCQESSTIDTDSTENVNKRKSTFNLFQIENLKEKSDAVQFYTGFDSYHHFMLAFNLLIRDEVNNMKYYPSLQPAHMQPRKHVLTPYNQFYLTLVKLRRNMCNKELSILFHIDVDAVRTYFKTWIDYLYCKFTDLKDEIPKETSDENAKQKTSSSIIIDCTAISEKPRNPVSSKKQKATHCNNKSANSLKVVVGISGSGCVNFVSNAYGGSISDSELFKKCGVVQQENVLGDQASNVQDPVSNKDVTGNISESEAHQRKKCSNAINFDHVTGLGKKFKILRYKFSPDLVPLGGRIIFVCYMLANFRKKII